MRQKSSRKLITRQTSTNPIVVVSILIFLVSADFFNWTLFKFIFFIGCRKSSSSTKWEEKLFFPPLYTYGNSIGSYLHASFGKGPTVFSQSTD